MRGTRLMPMEDLMNVTIDDLKNDELNEILADFMKKEHTFDHGTETLLKVLYTLLIVSGILANIVIIGVIIVNKRLFTSNNILLINLFVSDILLCIFCMPFTLIAITRRSWPFGAAICKLVPFIQAVTTFVSAVTISSIAIDRMFQITANQYSVRGLVTQSSPKLMKYGFYTLIIWIISMLLSAPICVYQSVVGFGIKELILYDKCVENWPNNNRGIYSFVILITQLLIPSCVMLVSHYRIRSHLNSNRIIRWSNYHFRQHSSSSSIHSINNNNNDENIRHLIF
ncbi:unnamed protein product [Medioppia subpectinata]|uniref:G-protein coupled receptors family 1 profile domain-containing protein n=1 Tax=Medioppia subpectinata TaxID=1979941 RepID=A0A7R9Q3C5_9ACAR|nr:unnamed protein product [Medioppia subpectinata]CAG2110314.1 unnamed protein product [Medioppia subpectinata]